MGNELYELNIDTKTGKSLKQFGTTSSGQFNNVVWSPDGNQLAYYDFKSGGLAIVDVNGGNPLLLTRSSFVFAWSPDGKGITTVSHNGDDWMVKNLGVNGSAAQPVLTIKNDITAAHVAEVVVFQRHSPSSKSR